MILEDCFLIFTTLRLWKTNYFVNLKKQYLTVLQILSYILNFFKNLHFLIFLTFIYLVYPDFIDFEVAVIEKKIGHSKIISIRFYLGKTL